MFEISEEFPQLSLVSMVYAKSKVIVYNIVLAVAEYPQYFDYRSIHALNYVYVVGFFGITHFSFPSCQMIIVFHNFLPLPVITMLRKMYGESSVLYVVNNWITDVFHYVSVGAGPNKR